MLVQVDQSTLAKLVMSSEGKISVQLEKLTLYKSVRTTKRETPVAMVQTDTEGIDERVVQSSLVAQGGTREVGDRNNNEIEVRKSPQYKPSYKYNYRQWFRCSHIFEMITWVNQKFTLYM